MSVLTDIQCELKAPKGRTNKFGGYKYRSCEDILEAVKPILQKHGATVTIRDEIVLIGERYYVKATAHFNVSGKETAEVSAFAREAESKKGMDDSQITGTASSYARKYALNGLFLIDDTKDADTDEYTEQVNAAEKVAKQKIGKVKGAALEKMLIDSGQDIEKVKAYYKFTNFEDLTEEQHARIVSGFQQKMKEKNGHKGTN